MLCHATFAFLDPLGLTDLAKPTGFEQGFTWRAASIAVERVSKVIVLFTCHPYAMRTDKALDDVLILGVDDHEARCAIFPAMAYSAIGAI